jgi:hypothetical protein
VVTHSVQSQAVPYFEFLKFLHGEASAGERSRTVSAVIKEKLLPEKMMPEELSRAVSDQFETDGNAELVILKYVRVRGRWARSRDDGG